MSAIQGRRVLIVEDERKLAAVLRDYLVADGAEVDVLHHGDDALVALRQSQPDLVLLDLMLPGTDGLGICRDLRSYSTVPVIMVTARVEEIDRLLGLELGADDYICKPFSPREVLARVRALLRRAHVWQEVPGAAPAVASGPLQVDEERFEARWHGQPLELTPVEFRLLKALLERPGRVLSRARLLEQIYLDHRVVSDRTVDSHVKNLRRKFEDARPGSDPIRSIYGVGYKWEPPGA
ncbi:MAG: response regulator [Xanthomonadales bacterium]|nr:Transcriptional regulatory protein BaeR [Xanthomonadales bacterium]MCC6594608.1 response regulator [Xanthomonadales bacterium]MCE7932801.1 response regulator [Xanthomonadales bacterium PRO6]